MHVRFFVEKKYDFVTKHSAQAWEITTQSNQSITETVRGHSFVQYLSRLGLSLFNIAAYFLLARFKQKNKKAVAIAFYIWTYAQPWEITTQSLVHTSTTPRKKWRGPDDLACSKIWLLLELWGRQCSWPLSYSCPFSWASWSLPQHLILEHHPIVISRPSFASRLISLTLPGS